MSASQSVKLVPSHAGRWRHKGTERRAQESEFRVVPMTQEKATMKDKSSQGIVLDENSQEQPINNRAQTSHTSKPGHMPQQPVNKDDELQPLKDKSGF
jgi:hypothetical protein